MKQLSILLLLILLAACYSNQSEYQDSRVLPNTALIFVQQKNKWGAASWNDTRKVIIPIEHDKEPHLIKTGEKEYAILAQKNGKWGAFNKEGNQWLDYNYDTIIKEPFFSNIQTHLIVKNEKGYGVINLVTKQEILEAKYSTVNFSLYFNEKLRGIIANEGKYWVAISPEGKALDTFEYATPIRADGMVIVKEDESWGLWNIQRQEYLISTICDTLIEGIEKEVYLQENRKWSIYDIATQKRDTKSYDIVRTHPEDDNAFLFKRDNRWRVKSNRYNINFEREWFDTIPSMKRWEKEYSY